MELELTHQQGQGILQFLGMGVRMPEQLGRGDAGEKFDDIERSYIDEQLVKLRKLFLVYSSRKSDTKQIMFGDPENLKLEKPDSCPNCMIPLNGRIKAVYDFIDREQKFKIRLDDDTREGLYWAILLLAHPNSPHVATVAQMDEVVLPIAKLLGADRQLAAHTKAAEKKARKIVWDDSNEWNKRKSDSKKVELDKPKKLESDKA